MRSNEIEETGKLLRVWDVHVRRLVERGRRLGVANRGRVADALRQVEATFARVERAYRALRRMPNEGAGECLVELDERWRDLRRATGWLARELREVEGDTGAAARRA